MDHHQPQHAPYLVYVAFGTVYAVLVGSALLASFVQSEKLKRRYEEGPWINAEVYDVTHGVTEGKGPHRPYTAYWIHFQRSGPHPKLCSNVVSYFDEQPFYAGGTMRIAPLEGSCFDFGVPPPLGVAVQPRTPMAVATAPLPAQNLSTPPVSFPKDYTVILQGLAQKTDNFHWSTPR